MQHFKSLKLYIQISIVSLLSLSMFLSVMIFSYIQATTTFKEKNEQYTNQVIAQLKQTIYSNYHSLCKLTDFIAFDKSVQNFLLEEDDAIKFEYYNTVMSNLINLKGLNDQILDIVIVDNNGKKYSTIDGKNFDITLTLIDNKICVSPILHFDKMSNSMPYLIMGKNIYSTNSYIKINDKLGSIYFILNKNALASSNQPSYSKSNSKIFLFDSQLEPFWSNSGMDVKNELSQLPYVLDLQNDKFLNTHKDNIKIETLPDIPISIVSILQNEDLINDIMTSQFSSYTIFFIALAIIVILWGLFIRSIVSPLKKLVSFISTIKNSPWSGLKSRANLSGYEEISIINTEFNEMLETIQSLTHQLFQTTSSLYELEIDKREVELAHLRSQINPHFLFNTLESIKGIALEHGIPEISKITKSLGTIFKYSVKGENFVPLNDELKIAKNYVEIQLFRFSDRFDVTYDVDEACGSAYVPKMILQPIIENAIVHGIESHDGFCQLKLSACMGESLVITITDDGNGIPPLKLQQIKEHLACFERLPQTCEHGIGIHNINNRIKLLYSDPYGVSIDSKLGEGTVVTIILPIDRR